MNSGVLEKLNKMDLGTIWEHYTGSYYKIVSISNWSGAKQGNLMDDGICKIVLYECILTKRSYSQDLGRFLDYVDLDDTPHPRFRCVADSEEQFIKFLLEEKVKDNKKKIAGEYKNYLLIDYSEFAQTRFIKARKYEVYRATNKFNQCTALYNKEGLYFSVLAETALDDKLASLLEVTEEKLREIEWKVKKQKDTTVILDEVAYMPYPTFDETNRKDEIQDYSDE